MQRFLKIEIIFSNILRKLHIRIQNFRPRPIKIKFLNSPVYQEKKSSQGYQNGSTLLSIDEILR
jgi:hypothetical protein